MLCSQLSQTFNHAYHFSILGREIKQWNSWAISCLAGDTRCSNSIFSLSLWEKLQSDEVSLGTEQYSLGQWMIQVKWNCSFLSTLFNCIYSLPLHPTVCWNFCDGLLDSHEDILIHGSLSRSMFYGGTIVNNLLFSCLTLS